MARFLFWNLNRRDIPGFVGTLAREQEADVLILAECRIPEARLLEELNSDLPHYQYAWGNCNHLLFFTRFDAKRMRPLRESNRVSIRRLELGEQSILIAGAHLPSKLRFSDESQMFESVQLSRMIDEVEKQEGHQRTVLLGDLNMNPFEVGMVGARGGLHAVMSRRVAERCSRVVQAEKCTFFYNPMWNHLGDRGGRSGTFYYESGEAVCYFWNVFDQVLPRPELLKVASDHLPVVLELKI